MLILLHSLEGSEQATLLAKVNLVGGLAGYHEPFMFFIFP